MVQEQGIDQHRIFVTDRSRVAAELTSASATRRSLNEEALVEALAEIRLGVRESGRPGDGPATGPLRPTQPQPQVGDELDAARREIAQLREKLAQGDDLDAARREIAQLREKLDKKEAYVKSVTSMLNGMGIRAPKI